MASDLTRRNWREEDLVRIESMMCNVVSRPQVEIFFLTRQTSA